LLLLLLLLGIVIVCYLLWLPLVLRCIFLASKLISTAVTADSRRDEPPKTLAVNANKAKVKTLQPQVRLPTHTYTHIYQTHTHMQVGRWVKNLQIDGQQLANNNNNTTGAKRNE